MSAHVKVRPGLGVRHVAIWRVGVGARRIAVLSAAPVLVVEAVHSAIGSRITTAAVARREEPVQVVFDIPGGFQADRPEHDLVALGVITVRLRSRAGESVEQIVEAAILLNDDDDMAYLAARGGAMDTREAIGGQRNR